MLASLRFEYSAPGAQKVKGLAQGNESDSLAELGLEPLTF